MSDKIPWEVGKEYTLRNGAKVQIFATDNACGWPIQGRYYDDKYHGWLGAFWGYDGHMQGRTGDFDLMPPAKPRIKGECWLVLGKYSVLPLAWISRDTALHYAEIYSPCSILHVPYDVEEGDGLE